MVTFTQLLTKWSSDPSCQLYVLGHDGNAFCVNRAEIGVLEEPDNVAFSRLLKRNHGLGLPAIRFAEEERLNLTHQTRKRKSSN